LADETLLHTVEVAVAIIALRPEPDSERYNHCGEAIDACY
jgi:hypothetical protein